MKQTSNCLGTVCVPSLSLTHTHTHSHTLTLLSTQSPLVLCLGRWITPHLQNNRGGVLSRWESSKEELIWSQDKAELFPTKLHTHTHTHTQTHTHLDKLAHNHTNVSAGDDGSGKLCAWLMIPQPRVLIAFRERRDLVISARAFSKNTPHQNARLRGAENVHYGGVLFSLGWKWKDGGKNEGKKMCSRDKSSACGDASSLRSFHVHVLLRKVLVLLVLSIEKTQVFSVISFSKRGA